MSSPKSSRARRSAWRSPIAAAAAVGSLLILAAPSPSQAAGKPGASTQAEPAASRHVFVEVSSADAGRPIYVQQQVPYTVRLFFDDTVRNGDLAAPSPANAVVEQLGDEKRGTAVRGGRSFNVIERNYAIAPEKSGTLRIPPVAFSGSEVAPRDGSQQDQGDADPGAEMMARMLRNTPFANDPMLRRALSAGMPALESEQPISAQSVPLVVDVKPRPAAAGADWLPAEAISLHDSWQDDPPQLEAGEPATRTITIEATGLSASQIPPLSAGQPTNARLYTEAADNQSRTDGKQIFGVSRQKLTYIPDAQGKLTVPAIALPWWELGADAPRTATLPAMSLNVAPGPGVGATKAPPVAAAPSNKPADEPVAGKPPLRGDGRAWGSLGGSIAVLLVALGLWTRRTRGRRVPGNDSAPSEPGAVPRSSASLRALGQACAANDARAAASALLDLGRAQWPKDSPRGLGQLAARLGRGAEEVIDLDRCLYGAAEQAAWQGNALWQAMRDGPKFKQPSGASVTGVLPALYPAPTTR